MKTNLNYLSDDLLLEEDLKKNEIMIKWLENIYVTEKSKFNDDIWHLHVPGIYRDNKRILDWNRLTTSGHDLRDYPNILESIKRIVFLIQTTIETRVKRKALSQKDCYIYLRCFADWLINNKIYSFKEFNQKNLIDYIDWLKKEKIKSKNKNLSAYIYAIRDLVIFKDYLQDKIDENIFLDIDILSLVKVKRADETKTLAIPNVVLEKICKKIFSAIDKLEKNEFQLNPINKQNIIIRSQIFDKSGNKIREHLNIEYSARILNSICYFIIGLYTGMRMAEILAMKKDCIEIDNGIILLKSTLFKITCENSGRPEKWACGLDNENNYALKAIKILSNITPKEYENLFFTYPNKKIKELKEYQINKNLNELMEFCEVKWDISTHQLRKTFAKLIGITDKTCLVALKEHFKHASLAMTDYYVGKNYELIEMINEEKQREIADGLDEILSSENLAGKLGEKITKTNLQFRGNVELRKNYIKEIINNSDLVVVPHEYGFCIYQPEQAKCKGENKNIGLNTCTKCNNFAVSEKHKVFWINRLEQYELFKEQLNSLPKQKDTIEELNYEIRNAISILRKIN